MSHRYSAMLVIGLAVTSTASADSILEFQTTEFGGGEPIVGTVQVATSGANTRLEIISVTSDEAGGMIYHGDEERMVILDHAQGSYMEIDQQQIDSMAQQVSGAMTQMQDALASMPPEERALAEQMMKQQFPTQRAPPPPATINDLGSHGEVIGIACRNFEVIRGGRKVRELCVSNWEDIHGGHETANAIKSVADFFEGMRQAYSSSGGMGVFDRQQELFEHMKELDGYPVLYRDFAPGGSLQRQTVLTGAREETIPPGRFDPPPSYQLQEMPMGAN